MNWAYRDLATFYALAGNIDEARSALGKFVATRPGISIRQVRESLKFMSPPILARYIEGLRIAGLPD